MQRLRPAQFFFALIILLLAVAPRLHAQVTLRGRIDRRTSDGVYPAVGVTVTLRTRGGAASAPTNTNQGGMYYISRVPPGDYVIEVRVSEESAPIMSKQVHVPAPNRGATVFDIPPIPISY
jgi:hypothetical protein